MQLTVPVRDADSTMLICCEVAASCPLEKSAFSRLVMTFRTSKEPVVVDGELIRLVGDLDKEGLANTDVVLVEVAFNEGIVVVVSQSSLQTIPQCARHDILTHLYWHLLLHADVVLKVEELAVKVLDVVLDHDEELFVDVVKVVRLFVDVGAEVVGETENVLVDVVKVATVVTEVSVTDVTDEVSVKLLEVVVRNAGVGVSDVYVVEVWLRGVADPVGLDINADVVDVWVEEVCVAELELVKVV